ncbi:MAG: tyrosine-type recombinase/integrase [Microvirga sp.]|jgi:integrase
MRAIHKLSAGRVEAEYKRKIKRPQMIHDGGGLYLRVARNGSVSWLFRYQAGRDPLTGKRKFRDMGLGALHKAGIDQPGENLFDVSLAKAREKAQLLRASVTAGKDPIDERAKTSKSGVTFRAAFEYMNKLEPRPHWEDMLRIYAMPVFGDKLVDDITTADVTELIAKVVNAGRHETARKLQQKIQAVLRSATGSIDTVAHKQYICLTLRSFKKVKKNRPHPSLDYEKAPTFYAELRANPAIAARALEFVMLTACRTGDIIGVSNKGEAKPPMRWTDIDRKRRVWIVPAVKTADSGNPEPFEVPLSDAALDVLRRVEAMKLPGDIVFPSQRNGTQPLARSAMLQQIINPMLPGITIHGMRATFRTWASEKTDAERDVIETAMAHRIFSEDKAEAPYKAKVRFLDKRRVLMQRWAEHLTSKSKVVALRKAA